MRRAGFVGVGFMGRGMLRNIVKKTNAEIVSIYDVNPSNIDNFMDSLTSEETVKVRICRSPADVAKRSDIVSLSLPSEKITSNVLFGDGGLLEGFLATGENLSEDLSSCPIVVDHGTFSRSFVIENNSSMGMLGVTYIDAPVSGGPGGAEAGTLTVMMGGNPVTVGRVKPLLENFSTNIVHFGDIGCGAAAKLVNQALVGMHLQAAVEAISLAEKMGLADTPEGVQLLQEMLRSSWGQSKILDLTFSDYLAALRHPQGFESDIIRQSAAPLRNLDKDFGCVRAELPENGNLQLPILKVTGDAISQACSAEKGLKDSAFLSLIELLRKNKSKQ